MQQIKKMERLAIIGAGDLGQLIAHHAFNDKHYSIAGFFDDTKTAGEEIGGIKVLGGTADVERLYKSGSFDCMMIGIGYKHMSIRKKIFVNFYPLIPFGSIIHS